MSNSKYKYTQKELDTIDETLDIITADLKELWKRCEYDKLEIRYPSKIYGVHYNLFMNDERICLYAVYSLNARSIFLEKKSKFGIKKRTKIEPEISKIIIENYQEARSEIIRLIELSIKEKTKSCSVMQEIKDMYSKTSMVEIDMPKSQNVHQIEITEENGQTIGTINFGRQTIRIMTIGDIVLVDKRKEEFKTKQI